MSETETWCVKEISTGKLITGLCNESKIMLDLKLMKWDSRGFEGYKVVKVKISEVESE